MDIKKRKAVRRLLIVLLVLGVGCAVDDVVQSFTGILVLQISLMARRGGWKEPKFS